MKKLVVFFLSALFFPLAKKDQKRYQRQQPLPLIHLQLPM
jgi:hypothetical protein